MKIKRIPFDPHLQFNDIDGVKREWNGIPLPNRIPFLLKKQELEQLLLKDEKDARITNLVNQLVVLAGLKTEWLSNSETSLVHDFLFGSVDEEGIVPSLIEATEFPYKTEAAAPGNKTNDVEALERCDRIWISGLNEVRLVAAPLTGNQGRELNGYQSVMVELNIEVGVAEAYDTNQDFRYCCDSILGLYGIDPEQIRVSQLSELIFYPGYLGSLEIPLSQTIGGDPLAADEDPYDSVLASLCLLCPSVPIHEHVRLMDALPWVQVMSIVNSVNTLADKRHEELDRTRVSKTGPKSKSKGRSGNNNKSWKKNEFDSTKSKLELLKSGKAKITPMSKMQQAALGG